MTSCQGAIAHIPDEDWTATERSLLDTALEFFGAAQSVIDYAGPEPPRLRYDPHGLQAVRDAMAALDARICAALDEGLTTERIARVTRLEPEIVELIAARHRGGETASAG